LRVDIRIALAVLMMTTAFLFPSQGWSLELGDVLKAPAQYDGQSVKVAGMAGEPRYQESRGKPFTVFDLSDDQGRTLRVFSWGRLQIHRGESLVVEGTFLKSKQIGRHSIQNEIEATRVNPAAHSH
jgi:hypothetical protein